MRRCRSAAVLLVASFLAVAGRAGTVAPAREALVAELARWSGFLRRIEASDGILKDVQQSTEPALARAQRALDEGHDLLALLRLASARENLAAAAYLGERSPGQRKDMAAVEAEWKRMGGVLRENLAPPRPEAVEAVRPALVRALAEAALPQVRIYYDASLEYGRSTSPDAGLFYLGAAQAARDFADFARRLSQPTSGPPPPLRALGPDLDALEGEILAAYRPPLSIDKHREFIGASSALKEARELEAFGLRHGALLRYLQAALRFGSLRAPAPSPAELAKRLDEAEARLPAGADHTLARVFVQAARSDLAEQGETGAAVTAGAVVADVLPRYLAALGPAPARAARPEPRVTVTLVRWPYT